MYVLLFIQVDNFSIPNHWSILVAKPRPAAFFFLSSFLLPDFASSTVCIATLLAASMDVVLEVFDTFIFDRLYAGLLPATSIDFTTNIVKDAATTTFSSMHELPTPYHAASQFLQLKPSQYASMSHLPRHNIWRHTISLYLITWSVPTTLNPALLMIILLGSSACSFPWDVLLYPTFSSSIRPLSPIPNTWKIKFARRSGKPWYPFLSWLSSPHPSSSPKCEVTANFMTHHQKHLFLSTIIYNSLSSSCSQTFSSTGSTGAYIIL